jgi:hypothetical protein
MTVLWPAGPTPDEDGRPEDPMTKHGCLGGLAATALLTASTGAPAEEARPGTTAPRPQVESVDGVWSRSESAGDASLRTSCRNRIRGGVS